MKNQQKNSRREFIKKGTLAAAGTVGILSLDWQKAFSAGDSFETNSSSFEDFTLLDDEGTFRLPPLPYAYNALEPYIDAQTMEIHYTKHHQAYVDKLNAAIAKEPSLKGKSLEELLSSINSIPDTVKMQIRNQGGGHYNHSFFWQILTPKSDTNVPSGKLNDAIMSQWQTMDNFKVEFNKAGVSVFGSGWAWLIADKDGKLSIITSPNQDNSIMDIAKDKGKPIMGIDVWEHAYYLKHQNRRGEYLDDIWNVMNWKKAMELYG